MILTLEAAGDASGQARAAIQSPAKRRTIRKPGPGRGASASAAAAKIRGDASGACSRSPLPAPRPIPGSVDLECEMLVLGSGPGGYSGAFRAADLGMKTVLVERYPTLGGVCLNVGCIPSKALLHVAAVMDEAASLSEHGISFGAPKIDLAKLLGWKNKVVGKLTGGLTGMAKARKVEVVRGYGMFLDAHHVVVELTDGPAQNKTGAKKVVRFQKAIIAAGSQSVWLPFAPDDPRIVDSTGALELNRCRSACWSSAAASSVSKWERCIRRSARDWMWSRCSMA